MKRSNTLRGGITGLVLAMAVVVLSAQPAAAQAGQGAGWSAWLGCWEPIPSDDPTLNVGGPLPSLCFIPTTDASRVELLSVESTQVVGRQVLDASGAARPVEREGCTGTETMGWSADGRRLYQSSTYDCPGALQRASSGAFVITPRGEWVDVAAVKVRDMTDVRVTRYRPARQTERAVGEVARALEGHAMAMSTARTAASAPLAIADVVEASRRIDPAAVEGWLIESGQDFDIDRARLLELADADLSEGIIDIMVALSYPERFAIDRATGEGQRMASEEMAYRRGGLMDPWGYGYPYGSYYRGFYPGYFYSDPYYGYNGGFGYGGYGYGGGFYNRPVIVEREPEVDAGGRAVSGQGYTRRRSGGDTGSPSGPSNSAGRSGGSYDPPASSGGSSGSGDSGGSSGRTAKPRE